ncbi:MAG: hypothetical protein CMQ46_11620 [Gammaproteobacteria bacterium]|nr:hypothetical protein [Gammaproteobacteria bacterium]MBJ55895.1 hypothetical protein [Gammaproteobacteria bacterium]HBN15289.1 hypothetical protein [Pseudohongiella sp.]|tara:strand:+ start:513 stop:980 length:468 start_codon:yes stop_codon:yes gene_type:complete
MWTKFACRRVSADTVNKTVGLVTSAKTLSVLWTWLLLLVSIPDATAEAGATLDAQPQLCVIAPGEKLCVAQMHLQWTTARERDVCIGFAHQPDFLQCWVGQQRGDHRVDLAHNDNITVRLHDAKSGQILAELDIPVIKRDLRDTRRRRRHAWSIF